MPTTAFSANPPKPKPGPKKNQGIIRSVRAALFGGKEKAKKTKTPLPCPGGTISMIVGSVRPLHVVDIGYSPDRPGMASPAASTSSSGGGMSSYSSAQSLLDLDFDEGARYVGKKINNDGDGDVDDAVENFYDGIQGDEMIDVKAEEFIAKFYQQVHVETPDRDLIR